MEEKRFESVAGEAQQHGYMPVEIAQQKALQRKQPRLLPPPLYRLKFQACIF